MMYEMKTTPEYLHKIHVLDVELKKAELINSALEFIDDQLQSGRLIVELSDIYQDVMSDIKNILRLKGFTVNSAPVEETYLDFRPVAPAQYR